jgi:hypothetical protein
MNLNDLIEKIGPYIASNAEVLAFVAAVVATILVLVLLFRLNSSAQPQQPATASPSTATAPIDKPVTAAPLRSPLTGSDNINSSVPKPEKQATAIAEQFAPASPSQTLSSTASAKTPTAPPKEPAPMKPQDVASKDLQAIEAELIALKALFKDGHISAQIYALKSQQIARKLTSV